MNKEELLEKIKNHPVIKELKEIADTINYGDLNLVGGAVVDILEGREPKDYDFVDYSQVDLDRFRKAGFKHVNTTKSAETYKKGDITVQFITFKLSQFGYKIEQSRYKLKNEELTVDEDSFDNKHIIPVSFEEPQNIHSAVMRLPHWEKKGYKMPELTYLSLMNVLFKTKSHKS